VPRVGVQTYLSCGLNRVNGADLNLANLNLANLAGADLTDANLALVANLTGALWSATTRWPESIAAEVVARSEEVHPGGLAGCRFG
jgi:Pentapeptide repeats (8 copies)